MGLLKPLETIATIWVRRECLRILGLTGLSPGKELNGTVCGVAAQLRTWPSESVMDLVSSINSTSTTGCRAEGIGKALSTLTSQRQVSPTASTLLPVECLWLLMQVALKNMVKKQSLRSLHAPFCNHLLESLLVPSKRERSPFSSPSLQNPSLSPSNSLL